MAKVFSLNNLKVAMQRADAAATAPVPDFIVDEDGLDDNQRRLRRMKIDDLSREIGSGQRALVDLQAEAHCVLNGIRAAQEEIVRRLPDLGIAAHVPKDDGT